MNLDHKSQQLGVPIMSPNSWEFRSHIREPNQVWNQILYLLAKSQDLGMSYQKGLGSMHFSPNSLKARFFLYQCYHTPTGPSGDKANFPCFSFSLCLCSPTGPCSFWIVISLIIHGCSMVYYLIWPRNHLSHKFFYFNEFVANVLRDVIGIFIFDLRGHGGC